MLLTFAIKHSNSDSKAALQNAILLVPLQVSYTVPAASRSQDSLGCSCLGGFVK